MQFGDSRAVRAASGHSSKIPGVELLERVSMGRRAELWRGSRAGGRPVAVKIFHGHLARGPQFLPMFEKLSAALMALAHPNILSVHDRGEAGAQYYLVCEWIEGGSLRDQLQMGTIEAKRAVEIGLDVCEALDHLHRRAILHRHLVLENVFVNGQGRAVLGDAGLSLLNEGFNGDGYEARQDLRDLNRLLYELVTGSRAPDPYRPGSLASCQPLDEFLTRALSTDSKQNFNRAGEMALALRLTSRAVSGNSVLVPQSSPSVVEVIGHTIMFSLGADADLTNARETLSQLTAVLARSGPWKLGYDLGSASIIDDALAAHLRGIHQRFRKNIERIAFYSPRALVRSSALSIGGGVDVPYKMFGVSAPMRQWLEHGRVD